MKWITPDGDNLYKDEVLAFNLVDWLIGHLYVDGGENVYCDDDDTVLEKVMYYIPIIDLELDLEQSDNEE